jgi:general secretion pathway protein G
MQQPYRSEAPPQTSGLAISSLVLGILSCTLLGFVAGIPAIICGHSARKKVRISPRSYGGGGLAVAGLVLGYVGTVVSALLVLVIVVSGIDSAHSPRIMHVQSDLQIISTQLGLYREFADMYPTGEQGLRALVEQPTTGQPPPRWYQLFRELPKDPWGHDYVYRCPGPTGDYTSYDLFSAGPDGVPDTTDDIRKF